MKFIFLNRFYYPDTSATSLLVTDLTVYLAQHNISTCVITSRQLYNIAQADLPNDDFKEGVRIYRVWSTTFGRSNLIGRLFDSITFYTGSGWRLFRILSKGDIVIVKTDPPLISVLVWGITRFRGNKYINWIQDVFPEIALALNIRGINNFTGNFLRKLRNLSLHHAKINVVVSSGMMKHFRKEGIAREKTKVIHNWSNGNKIQPIEPNRSDYRRQWKLEGKFIVGYSGNIGRVHEFKTVVEAANLLKKEEKIVFIFIGEGAQLSWIKEETDRLRLKNIYFKPYQPLGKLGESLSISDVHLITLNPGLEGLVVPSKFYAILAAGRAILYVGNPKGEIGTLLKKERCGYAIPAGAAEIMAEQIRHLAKHQSTCAELGKQARRVYDQQYNRDAALQLWQDVLKTEGKFD